MKSVPTIRLVQLPAPPPAALMKTGNAALSPGCLASAGCAAGVGARFYFDVVPPSVSDSLGDAALAARLAEGRPAMVGFSLYLWNIERSLHLAREIKRRSPGTMIAVGGPEVQPDNGFLLSQGGFDIGVVGEGELALMGILSRQFRRGMTRRMRTSSPGHILLNGEPLFDLRLAPSPYLSGHAPMEKGTSVYIETARGCASGCAYCFYSGGNPGVRRIEPRAIAGLVRRLHAAGAEHFTILDPTFNLRPDFDAILRELAALNRRRRLSFFAEIRAETLSDAQMELLARAGFTKLEVGLQSVNEKTLKGINRGGKPGDVIRAAKKLKKRGIELLVDLMIGLPGDSAADVLRGVRRLSDAGLGDFVQIMPLSVLPGTVMRAQAASLGLRFDHKPPYRVLGTRPMSGDELVGVIPAIELILGRRVDEIPRPFLAARSPTASIKDVYEINLDGSESDAMREAAAPGARHAAVWFRGKDLFEQRKLIGRVLSERMRVDPFCTLDVVLVAREPFPLDLLGEIRRILAAGPEWYLTRQLALRGEDAARRICVLIPRGADLPVEYIETLMAEVPVFREMRLAEAASCGRSLGYSVPSARIVSPLPSDPDRQLALLLRRADHESVAFASRKLEGSWTNSVL